MENVLVLLDSMDPKLIDSVFADRRVKLLKSMEELVRAIIEKDDVLCAIVQKHELGADEKELLASVKNNFPILKICLVTEAAEIKKHLWGIYYINDNLSPQQLKEALWHFLSSLSLAERREYNRFDWPLLGYLTLENNQRQEYNIRSLSASGAFLECSYDLPQVGQLASLRIQFLDFFLFTECQITENRHTSRNLPAGISLKFTRLSEPSQRIINSIICDALVRLLLNRKIKAKIPQLGTIRVLNADFDLL